MEKIYILSTATIAFVTVLLGAGSIATYLSQFLGYSKLEIVITITIYILLIILYIIWIRRKIN